MHPYLQEIRSIKMGKWNNNLSSTALDIGIVQLRINNFSPLFFLQLIVLEIIMPSLK